MDFMHDQLEGVALPLVQCDCDDFKIEKDWRLKRGFIFAPQRGNTFALTRFIEWRGKTEANSAADNGPELLVKLWASWAKKNDIEFCLFSGNPQQNAYV